MTAQNAKAAKTKVISQTDGLKLRSDVNYQYSKIYICRLYLYGTAHTRCVPGIDTLTHPTQVGSAHQAVCQFDRTKSINPKTTPLPPWCSTTRTWRSFLGTTSENLRRLNTSQRPASSSAPQKKLVSLKLRAVQSWEHFLILTARLVSAGLKQFTGQITKRKINAAIQHNSVFIPTGVSSSDGQCSVVLARYRYTVWPHCSLPACIINEVKMPKGRKDTARPHDFVSVKRSCCKCRQRHLAKTWCPENSCSSHINQSSRVI